MKRRIFVFVIFLCLLGRFTDAAPSKSPSPAKSAPKPSTKPSSAKPKAPVKPQAKAQAAQELPPLVKKLTPIDSGRGIVICEPVSTSLDESQAHFGASCGRWLQYIVGGHGELGQTPLWDEIGISIHEMNRKDLQLTPADLPHLFHSVGITNAATGTIAGTPEQSTLSYQLWRLPKSEKNGAPIEIQGTRDEIIEKLPGMATEITKRLGIAQPRVPAVGVKADDMRVLGKLAWQYRRTAETAYLFPHPLSPSEEHYFFDLAPASPFLHFLLAGNRQMYLNRKIEVSAATREAMADNVMLLEKVGIKTDDDLKFFKSQKGRSYSAFPNNYALQNSLSEHLQSTSALAEARATSEHAARCAYKNPWAWAALGDSINRQASAIRQGRYYNAMSDDEKATVEAFYDDYIQVATMPPRLNSKSSSAWLSLSNAATLYSEPELALYAVNQAVELDPHSLAAYQWGLEITQPKWFDEPKLFMKFAELSTKNPARLLGMSDYVSRAFVAVELPEKAQEIRDKMIPTFREVIRTLPDDEIAKRLHRDFVTYLQRLGMPEEARAESLKLAEMRPESALAHNHTAVMLLESSSANFSSISENLDEKKLTDPKVTRAKAETHLLKAIELDPHHWPSLTLYGSLFQKDNLQKAEEYLLKGHTAAPTAWFPTYTLAQFYWQNKKDYEKAIQYARAALKTRQNEGERHIAYLAIVRSLQSLGRTDEAKATVDEAIKLGVNAKSFLTR